MTQIYQFDRSLSQCKHASISHDFYAVVRKEFNEVNASSLLNRESEITSAVASLEKSVIHSTKVELLEETRRSRTVWTILVAIAEGSLDITSNVIELRVLLYSQIEFSLKYNANMHYLISSIWISQVTPSLKLIVITDPMVWGEAPCLRDVLATRPHHWNSRLDIAPQTFSMDAATTVDSTAWVDEGTKWLIC